MPIPSHRGYYQALSWPESIVIGEEDAEKLLAPSRTLGRWPTDSAIEPNKELRRRLAALDRGERVDADEARARLQRKSEERREKRA